MEEEAAAIFSCGFKFPGFPAISPQPISSFPLLVLVSLNFYGKYSHAGNSCHGAVVNESA